MGAMRRADAGFGKTSGQVLQVEPTGLFNGLDIQGKVNDEKYEVDSDFWPEQLNDASYEDSKGQTILFLCLSTC